LRWSGWSSASWPA
jgi:hypothetical protein